VPELPILARTLRGLEWIAGAEVQATIGPPRIEVGHRELRLSVAELGPLSSLGTVDDVFVIARLVPGVDRTRESLQRLAESAASVDLERFRSLLGRAGSFDVVGSFVGKRNYSRFEIEDAFGAALSEASGWSYLSRSGGEPARGALSLRIHAVGSEATIAVRIGEAPLHRRAYRVASRPGALHPPLARALALLVGLRPGLTLADPFCGTGTIPIEAKIACRDLQVSGSDLDPAAVAAARRNADAAGVELELATRDAADLMAADRMATNPPWGSAVRRAGRARHDFHGVERAVVLAPPEQQLDGVVLQHLVRVSGALAAINVLGDEPVDEAGLYGPELKETLGLRADLSEAASSPTSP
jgi:tRNA (guanine6-N2)-methyltransferase